MVSHELRTPLTAVLNYAKVLGRGELDSARAMTTTHTIERNAKVMRRMIDDLLDVSGPRGGPVCIEADLVDLVKVIHEALDGVHLAAEAAGLRLTLTAPRRPFRSRATHSGGGKSSPICCGTRSS